MDKFHHLVVAESGQVPRKEKFSKGKLENKTKEFLDLSFLIGGQSGSGQGAQSDQVITVPYSPNYRSHAHLMLSSNGLYTED